MDNLDRFDNFDLFSQVERKYRLKGLKLHRLHRFLEDIIAKYYEMYKTKRNSKISLNEYKIQFLKEYIRKKMEKRNNWRFYSFSEINFSSINLNEKECKY